LFIAAPPSASEVHQQKRAGNPHPFYLNKKSCGMLPYMANGVNGQNLENRACRACGKPVF
jgi:hypothetical protein